MRGTPSTLLPAALLLSLLTLAVACGGGGGAIPPPSPPTPPAGLQYPVDPGLYRVGEAIAPNVPSVGGGAVATWGVQPALPAGLALDPVTGAIAGAPTAEVGATPHTITASNAAGQTQATLSITVGPQLPAAFEALADGFAAEIVVEPGLPAPAKIAKLQVAPAPDGRIFYTEVDTGNVRVIHPQQGLLPVPFATLTVLQLGHMGLLGLALAPDFLVSGHVYALACIPGDVQPFTPDRIQVLRYTDVASLGTNETVVLDDLPVAPPGGSNNGGEILFDSAGNLFVSLGDVQNPATSQADTSVSLAGKVLRYDVSQVPAVAATGNPAAGDPEWCRGLRNTFGMAVHPLTGDLYGVDNGPAADDALNLLQPGKNFAWGGNPPPPDLGFTIRAYPTVIVPTALCFYDGTAWGGAYENNLFMTSYDDHAIRRFVLSGSPSFNDIDSETEFARLKLVGAANHPLDVCRAWDGALYLSTFSGIYRITKLD